MASQNETTSKALFAFKENRKYDFFEQCLMTPALVWKSVWQLKYNDFLETYLEEHLK